VPPTTGLTPDEDRPRRLARQLTLLTLLAIVHGSLYPWRFQAPPDWPDALQGLFLSGQLWANWGDLLGNVLLFLPLTAVGQHALPAHRERAWRWPLLVGGGVLLGVALQVVQIALPQRTPALADAWWNAVGLVLGLLLAPLVPALLRALGPLQRSPHRGALAVGALWLVLAWWPLLPGLSSRHMQQAWQHLLQVGQLNLHDTALQAVGVMILAAALRGLPGRVGALLLVVTLGWLGMLVFSQTLPVSMPSSTIGWALGLVAGLLLWALPGRAALVALAAAVTAALLTEGLRGVLWAMPAGYGPETWWPFRAGFGGSRVARTLGWLLWATWIGTLGAVAWRLGARPRRVWGALTVGLAALLLLQWQVLGAGIEPAMLLLPALCGLVLHQTARRGWWRPVPPAAGG
jgi:hypothetical protein